MRDWAVMYRRLFSLAFKRFGCDRDAAHDVAGDAVCAMIAAKTDDFNFGFTVVQNSLRVQGRNARRRKTYQFPVGEEGEPIELNIKSHFAAADQALIASECVTAISNLPDGTREVMKLVAMEYTPDEIVEARRIPKSEVYWRTQLGRKLLRQRDGYELERKRGHHRYIGIRKECRRWNATFRHGDDSYWLGTFATASEAASAYDAKAKEVLGAAAKLNFPEVR
jgi:DNA-directed RNA polymerase specialized sigma24 family protein